MRASVGLVLASALLILLAAAPAECLTVLPGWPQTGGSDSAPAVGDLDGDGKLEVVSVADQVYVRRFDGAVAAGWPQPATGLVGSPGLADLEGDGDLEVFTGAADGVHVWHGNSGGAIGWPAAVSSAISSSVAVGDLDDDGSPEVVAGSEDGKVYAWHADATPVEGWPKATGGQVTSTPALGDLDGDGNQEVVVGSADGEVYAWHGGGALVSGWPKTIGGDVKSSPALGDLDGDGDLEVVVGGEDGNVYAWHANGALVSGWPQPTEPSPYSGEPSVYSAPALGDLDGDGGLEVVVSAADAAAYAWHGNGVAVTGWPRYTYGFAVGSPSLGDLDGDGTLEVILGISHSGMIGYVYGWNSDGALLDGFPVDTNYYTVSSAALADFEGDGQDEVVIGGEDGKLYAWKVDATTGDRLPWTMFHHDPARTGRYVAVAAPEASFSPVFTYGNAPLTVHFTDESAGHPTSWLWDFGDGQTSAQQNPAHIYPKPGSYTVSLTASNVSGSDTATVADCVRVGLEVEPGWPQPGGSDSAPAVGDLDGDGKLEVVSVANEVNVLRFDGTPLAGWPQTAAGLSGVPLLVDLDKGGGLEVVIGAADGVHVWDGNGTAAAGWPAATSSPMGGSVAVADMDGDGGLEVVAGASDGKVYAWHADATPVTGWPATAGDAISSLPALDDLDGDGDLEVVIGAADGKVYAWHADGTPVTGWPVSIGGVVTSSPALGDLDADGDLDVVVGSEDGYVYAWDADGTLLAGWPQLTEPSPYDFGPEVRTAPALGDLDADGDLEVIVSAVDGAAYAWHANGMAVTGWPQSTGGFAVGSPALGDLDGDGTLEVVLGAAHSGMVGLVYGWNADGSLLAGFPQETGYYTVSSPALGDLEGDGQDELVIGAEDGNIYVWKLGSTTDDRLPWTMFHHDPARTGRYVATAIPVANFSATPTTGPAPLVVHFTDESAGHPTSWLWDFGDGTTSTQQNPNHEYTTAAAYTVTLTASNAAGSDTETKAGFITVPPPPPAAAFSGTPTTGHAPLIVQFTDESTGGATSWLWDFGDGTTSTQRNPSHSYAAAGSYTVSLTATNAGGSNQVTKEGYIVVTAPPAPEADFAGEPTDGTVPLTVTFTDLSTNEPTSWQWDFGDGLTSADRNPSHVYGSAGLYTVSLTATNAGGSDTEKKDGYVLATFTDVSEDWWAFAEIMACVDAGIAEGYPGGRYRPQDPVTRGQMAVYMARAVAGRDDAVPEDTDGATFVDVGTGYWAYRYIEYIAGLDIVQGFWNDTYRPEVVVTRDQMAVYIARSIADPIGDEGLADYMAPTVPSFHDVGTGFWAYRYIEYCAEHGVVQGYWDDTYHPERQVTRDQMAVYIARAFGLPM